jgi:UDP-N-acetylglucosamine transferase subunit ALG13
VIFVTIGSVLPFDRLIRAADEWASGHRETPALAQIGDGLYEPRFMAWVRKTPPDAFAEQLRRASVVVGHAGMGTIIESAEMGKPIVMMPRRLALKEHNTEHQLHTAKRFIGRPGAYVAMDETELPARIDEALGAGATARATLRRTAPDDFVRRIRDFLTGVDR